MADRDAVLAAGLAWLFDTEQPPGVLDQHHGVTSPVVENRRYGFCPRGAEARPVVVVDVADKGYEDGRPTNLLRPHELLAVAAAIERLGHRVDTSWNGDGFTTGSLGLVDEAHPTLLAAVDLYLAGCPTHHTTLCSWDGCSWFRDGNAGLIRPEWPCD